MGVEQLTETVHEFLDLTRIEAGELRPDLEPVDVSAVLAESLQASRWAGKGPRRRAACSNRPGLPRVSADPLRLRAVFDNILSNALKYTPSGERITVDSHRVASHEAGARDALMIGIVDTGPGIPVPFRPRIFDKFFRLEDHQSEGHAGARGAGIGLYMCRQIVELHGGEIA